MTIPKPSYPDWLGWRYMKKTNEPEWCPDCGGTRTQPEMFQHGDELFDRECEHTFHKPQPSSPAPEPESAVDRAQFQLDHSPYETDIAAKEPTSAPQQEEIRISNLTMDLARELYDRFAMGGWEPEDAWVTIQNTLERRWHELVRCETCGNELFEGHYSVICHKLRCDQQPEIGSMSITVNGVHPAMTDECDNPPKCDYCGGYHVSGCHRAPASAVISPEERDNNPKAGQQFELTEISTIALSAGLASPFWSALEKQLAKHIFELRGQLEQAQKERERIDNSVDSRKLIPFDECVQSVVVDCLSGVQREYLENRVRARINILLGLYSEQLRGQLEYAKRELSEAKDSAKELASSLIETHQEWQTAETALREAREALEKIAFGFQHLGVVPCPQDSVTYIEPMEKIARAALSVPTEAPQKDVKC